MDVAPGVEEGRLSKGRAAAAAFVGAAAVALLVLPALVAAGSLQLGIDLGVAMGIAVTALLLAKAVAMSYGVVGWIVEGAEPAVA